MDWSLFHLDWEGWGSGKKRLLHEIILIFGLLRPLQNDNGTSFTSKVTQGVSKALGITFYLHCAWRPQSSGKAERANQLLKSAIKMITQETSLGWKEASPLALLHTHIAPKEQAGLSPYEMLSWETFCLCQWPLPRSRGSDPPVLHHGHWTIPTGYMLVGYKSERKYMCMNTVL